MRKSWIGCAAENSEQRIETREFSRRDGEAPGERHTRLNLPAPSQRRAAAPGPENGTLQASQSPKRATPR
jgi:hypothetical protein